MKCIINGKVYSEEKFQDDLVLVFDDVVEAVVSSSEYSRVKHQWSELEEIDAGGQFVVPGFIDVHIHGFKGMDTMDEDPKAVEKIGRGIVENGVTAFLPTTMTMSVERINGAMDNIRRMMRRDDYGGALVLGAHMEGPFINKAKKGAQSEEYVIAPDEGLVKANKDVIKVMTIAPEVEGALEMIKKFSDRINFSLGHTMATYDEAVAAYKAGAKSATHLFNAMTGLNHREPGVVGAALSEDAYVELIGDKIHVHPSVFKVVKEAKGMDKVLLITDCIRAGGMPEGDYSLGGQPVKVEGGVCRLEDGTIAGSSLRLNEGLINFAKETDGDFERAIRLVTANQAEFLGVSDKMGTLESGKYANIVVLNSELNVMTTYVKGNKVYEN